MKCVIIGKILRAHPFTSHTYEVEMYHKIFWSHFGMIIVAASFIKANSKVLAEKIKTSRRKRVAKRINKWYKN